MYFVKFHLLQKGDTHFQNWLQRETLKKKNRTKPMSQIALKKSAKN